MLLGLVPAAWSGSKAAIAKLSAQSQPAYEPVLICVSEDDVWVVMPRSAWPSAELEAQLGQLTCLGEAEHPALRAEESWTRVSVELAFFRYSMVSFEEATSLLG